VLALVAAESWAACSGSAWTEDIDTNVEQDLNGAADENNEKKNLNGRSPQRRVWLDTRDNVWAAILWDKTDQRFEIWRYESSTWTSTNVAVHASGESSPTMRYRRRFDVEWDWCNPGLGIEPRVNVVSNHFTDYDYTGCNGTWGISCPIYYFQFEAVKRCSGAQPGTICTSTCSVGTCTVNSYALASNFPVAVTGVDIKLESAVLTEGWGADMWVAWTQPDTTGVCTASECVGGPLDGAACTTNANCHTGVVRTAKTSQACGCTEGGTSPGEYNGECVFGAAEDVATNLPLTVSMPGTDYFDDMVEIFPAMEKEPEAGQSSHGVGFLWSNQTQGNADLDGFHYRYYDQDTDDEWHDAKAVYTGLAIGDDHLSVPLSDYGGYRFVAVIKTSKDDTTRVGGSTTSSDPLTVLIRSNEDTWCDEGYCSGGEHHQEECVDDEDCTGTFSIKSTIAQVSTDHTRPAAVYDLTDECLYYLASDRNTGSSPYYNIVEQHTDLVAVHDGPVISWSGQDSKIDDDLKVNDASVPAYVSSTYGAMVIGANYENDSGNPDAGEYYACIAP